ncbi:MAG: DMT family transporter [Candidatus Dormibacteraeota bacterium]|nr:DMT family transporter [Candidatus Dormibacteraeota bacterium]
MPLLAFALIAGITLGVQFLLLGAIRVRRGVARSVELNFLGAFAGLAAILVFQAHGTEVPLLALGAIASAVVLVLLTRSLPIYFGGVGLLAVVYLVASAVGVQRLGVGVTVATVVAGQMFASIMLDRIGALGLVRREVTVGRALGAALVVVGAALMRLG